MRTEGTDRRSATDQQPDRKQKTGSRTARHPIGGIDRTTKHAQRESTECEGGGGPVVDGERLCDRRERERERERSGVVPSPRCHTDGVVFCRRISLAVHV